MLGGEERWHRVARIDSLLRLVLQQGADELRLGVERDPRMYARGAPKRLSVPATSEETLRILLGEILSAEVEAELRARGSLETSYEAAGLGIFRVKFSNGQTARFDVGFLHSAVHGPAEVTPLRAAGRGTLPDASGAAAAHAQAAAAEGGSAATRAAGEAQAHDRPAHAAPEAGRHASHPRDEGNPREGRGAAHPHTVHAPRPEGHGAAHAQTAPGIDDPAHTARAPLAHAEVPRAPQPMATGHAPSPLPAAEPRGRLPQPAGALIEWTHRAAALGASDLHLAEGEPPRLRVHGRLQQLEADPPEDLARLFELDASARAHLARGGSLDLGLDIPELGRVRAHLYRTDAGLAAALRLLPAAAPSFSALNMPLAFDDLVELPHGLVLVCGAAGSGKSTTLAALAQQLLHKRSLLLVTLEDPIEYALTPGPQSIVRRRQIGRDVPDFPAGLRDALRADPEVLLVGEMRDAESISLALTAAETGHLVLASMHSGSAVSAIERILDAYPAAGRDQVRAQLAESLRAVIVQRLLPRARGTGRLPAIEVLRSTRAVASLIREGKTAQLPTVLQSSRRDGMLALERSLADRVLAGEVKPEAAFAAANDPDTLQRYLDQRAS